MDLGSGDSDEPLDGDALQDGSEIENVQMDEKSYMGTNACN
jgi:hypothetical protein